MRSVSGIAEWFIAVYEITIIDLIQFFRDKLVVISTSLTSVSMVLSFGMGMNSPGSVFFGSRSYFDFIAPGIFAMGTMFCCTYTMGYGFIMDRQRRIIEDIIISPVSYSAFLFGRMSAMLIKSLLQFLVLLSISVFLFGLTVMHPFVMFLAFIFASVFFAGLGMLLATYNNEMSFSGIANLVLIPLFYFSGVFFPIDNFGQITGFLRFLPMSIHVAIFRYSTQGTEVNDFILMMALMIVYAAVMMVFSGYLFKWKVKNG